MNLNQLNVAVAVPVFPNPVQTYVLTQLSALKSMGVRTHVIANERGPDNIPDKSKSDLGLSESVTYISSYSFGDILKNIVSTPLLKTEYRNTIRKLIRHSLHTGQNRTALLKSLYRARAAVGGPYDILHSHSLFTSYDLMFMKVVLSVPLITTYHGRVTQEVKSLDDWKMKIVFDNGDAFLTNTEYAKHDLITLGCPEKKIHIIPQGIDLDRFEFKKRGINNTETIKLISIGRLSPEKGHLIALQAISELIDKHPMIEYHIIGQGPEKTKLIERSREIKLSEKIVLHGFKSGDELEKVFADAHILLLPSLRETQGVVMQEAQACGIPVIANSAGGIPEVIRDGVTGLLYEENCHKSLAEIIDRLITDPDLYLDLSEAGYRDVTKRFEISTISKRLIDIYKKTIESAS